MELPHDLLLMILEKLPVKSLLRLKSSSREWKSTIESPYFKERQLTLSRQSQDPNIFLLTRRYHYIDRGVEKTEHNVTRMLTLNPLDVVKLDNLCPPPKRIVLEDGSSRGLSYRLVSGSCDGLICLYSFSNSIHVVNPTTRWSRSVPSATFQTAVVEIWNQHTSGECIIPFPHLGFGKDKFTNTYKLVWLYNSLELGLENVTTCEVFDFSNANTWRYVVAAPCRINGKISPIYLDGSLYWFTDEDILETKILSFDFHTEKFQIISKAPFGQATCKHITMCNLNNRLCVSQKKWARQEIWSLDKSDMTWEKIYSFDLPVTVDYHLFTKDVFPCVDPIMVMKNKKSLLLRDTWARDRSLVIYHDPEMKSYNLCFAPGYYSYALSCNQSLMSTE